ncbi:cytochrome P450 [Xylariaceae sp. AK1471]|nr:cytochrome P450 [Xylariaceae sp. AK1471]
MSLFQLCAALVVFLLMRRLLKVGSRPPDFPPGPRTTPLIGNLHQIPRQKKHIQFERWAREFGPVYSLILGTKVMIVLNSDVAVKDLIDKRGAIYSSRPDAYIAQDILSAGLRPNHGAWTLARKLGNRILNTTTARGYVPYQDLESKAMLLGFLENPRSFIQQLRRYTASLTTQMTFGFRAATIHDPRFKEAFEIFDQSSEMIGSKIASLLDLIPILRHLPAFLLPIKGSGRRLHQQELMLFRTLYFSAKEGLKDGSAKPCFCVDLVKIQAEEEVPDDLVAYISGSLLQAGSETTSNILVAFIQAMVLFPDVARVAQSELDSVCGSRMPDLNDVPDLPYIRACAKETLRWMPGFMLGIPHAVTQDDSYLGYRIPKGATVILNAWAIHNDPKRHPNPRQFDPMRYIHDHSSSADSANSPDATKRNHFAFGAGRRRCQGMHIADRSIFLAISRLLWAFDFREATDEETGRPITPDMDDLIEGVMQFPRPFHASIRPRDATKAGIVREEWSRMRSLLDEQEQWKVVPEGLIWKDEQRVENE